MPRATSTAAHAAVSETQLEARARKLRWTADVLAWLAAAAAVAWGTLSDDGIRVEADTFFLIPAAVFVFLAIFPAHRGRARAFGSMAVVFGALYVVVPAIAGDPGRALSLPLGFQVSYGSTVARLGLAAVADWIEAEDDASNPSDTSLIPCWCGDTNEAHEQRRRRMNLR